MRGFYDKKLWKKRLNKKECWRYKITIILRYRNQKCKEDEKVQKVKKNHKEIQGGKILLKMVIIK